MKCEIVRQNRQITRKQKKEKQIPFWTRSGELPEYHDEHPDAGRLPVAEIGTAGIGGILGYRCVACFRAPALRLWFITPGLFPPVTSAVINSANPTELHPSPRIASS